MDVMKYWSFPSNTKTDKYQKVESMVKIGNYLGSRKVDGEHARFIIQNGVTKVLSRARNVAGIYADKKGKVPHIADWLSQKVPNNSILVGELYLKGNHNSSDVGTIMRCVDNKAVERQQNGSKLHFYIFDVWAWGGVEYFDCGMAERVEVLNSLRNTLNGEYVEVADYYDGEELWDKVGEWLEQGEEGAVLYSRTCPVYEKRTPSYATIKVKKELCKEVDCFFTGNAKLPLRDYTGKYVQSWEYWENEFTGEKLPVGSHFKEFTDGATILPVTKSWYYSIPNSFEVAVLRNGEPHHLCWVSGVTDDVREDFVANPSKYMYKPCVVSAMEISNTGECLRHPKFVRFRDDIDMNDCTFKKVFGYE